MEETTKDISQKVSQVNENRSGDDAVFVIDSGRCDALIFDMDGTIVDNMTVHHRAWQNLLAQLGYEWSLAEIKERVWGKNEEIFERLFPGKYTQEEIQKLAESKERHYVELYRNDIAMLDGLEQLLVHARARGIKLGIATAAPPICVEFVREALNLPRFFDVIVDAAQVVRGKPHPEVFLQTAGKLSVSPERCVVFEDAPIGVEAAYGAAMNAYVLLTTHAREEFAGFSNVAGFSRDFKPFSIG